MKYKDLHNFCLNLWFKYKDINISEIISKLKTTKILYGNISRDRNNFYALGAFNYILDFCSNIYNPNESLSVTLDNKKNYYKYYFNRNKLILVERYEGDKLCHSFYIENEYIFARYTDEEIYSLYLIKKNYQIEISAYSTEIRYIERLTKEKYFLLFDTLFFCSSYIYTKEGKYFCATSEIKKFVKSFEEVKYFSKLLMPIEHDDKFINQLLSFLSDPSYEEYSEEYEENMSNVTLPTMN